MNCKTSMRTLRWSRTTFVQKATFSTARSSLSQATSLEAGIVGLPNVGKSTLFNALTAAKAQASNYPFTTIDPNTGFHTVFDPNLSLIRTCVPAERLVPALVRVTDIAGIVKGAAEGKGLGNKFLSNIREVDAILHVVRCFSASEVTHVEGAVDPLRDAEIIDMELLLKDADTIEKALARTKTGKRPGKDKTRDQLPFLRACEECLSKDMPIRSILKELHEDVDTSAIKTLGLLTAKPVLYVGNVDDDQLGVLSGSEGGIVPEVEALRNHATSQNAAVVTVCAPNEADLTEIEDESDRAEMLEMMGGSEASRGVAHVGRAMYNLLGLQSFYTAGEKEVRAWPIRVGTLAPNAAGVIHSDFIQSFIRAECYSVNELTEYGSVSSLKQAGKIRSEGKTYVVQPDDVMNFLCGK
eukprot:CFRG4498T1